MKRILTVLCGTLMCMVAMLCLGQADAAEMVNVEYIHNAIKQKWDITVPYNAALENPRVAANMKYLLTAVDVANEMLNGMTTTDYGNGAYATLAAADTVATLAAVETLIKQNAKFFITTSSDTVSFNINISAVGNFLIDWGDGQQDILKRTLATKRKYTHTYSMPGTYTILITGRATGYSKNFLSAIQFINPQNIASISGNLGGVFPTIGSGI